MKQKDQFDVISLISTGAQNIPQAELSHGYHFTRAWQSLLSNLNYSVPEINVLNNITGFYGNAWFCRPALFVLYANFVARALEVVSLNETLNELLYVDSSAHVPENILDTVISAYQVDYIPLLPFIFERLPAFYFAGIYARVYHLGPDGCKTRVAQTEGSANTALYKVLSDGIMYNGSYIPFIIGVGPAKTFTSFLSDTFRQSKYVNVGAASRTNQICCSSELDFFRERWKRTLIFSNVP
jgi:hypothetical protein